MCVEKIDVQIERWISNGFKPIAISLLMLMDSINAKTIEVCENIDWTKITSEYTDEYNKVKWILDSAFKKKKNLE